MIRHPIIQKYRTIVSPIDYGKELKFINKLKFLINWIVFNLIALTE